MRKDLVAAQHWLIYAEKAACPRPRWRWATWRRARPPRATRRRNEKIRADGDQLVHSGGATPASPSAQFKLANAYFAGAGVARDPQQALRWYSARREPGHARGRSMRSACS